MQGNDFTKGSLTKAFLLLMAPLIVGNILQQLYNTIDALVLGWYAGQQVFAAVGVASSVMNLFLFAITGACIGLSVLLAQAYGAKDGAKFRQIHFLSWTAGLALSILGAVLGCWGIAGLLRLLQTPAEIIGFAQTYLKIVFSALPASFLYNFYHGLLRAVGKVRVSLCILAGAMAVNLALDLFFVKGLSMGIVGVAWATWLAQVGAALGCICYVYRCLPELAFHRSDCRFSGRLLGQILHYSGVTALQQAGLYLGKLLVQGAVNSMGTAVISAYTATIRIEGFANSFGDSGASATSVLAAQNYGAGQRERVEKTTRISFLLLSALGAVSSTVLYMAAWSAARLVLGPNSGEACSIAAAYLHRVAIFYILCFLGNTFAGYFDGCGHMTYSLLGTVSQISIRVVLSWLFISDFGLNTVAWATAVGWIYVNLFWLILYRRQRKKLW